jgi:hypothetical protein
MNIFKEYKLKNLLSHKIKKILCGNSKNKISAKEAKNIFKFIQKYYTILLFYVL